MRKQRTHLVDTTAAAALGAQAFADGRMRVPALDPAICAHIKGKDTAGVIAALDAWLKAWDRANLA